MARNLSVAMGRPLPALRIRNMAREVMETIGLVFAAGRVASAVESHRTPNAADLDRLGISDAATQVRRPFGS
ncbi:hypothetical protein JOD31_003515 [Methylopila capsulata]|uniref:Uncharacterized protein n=1 Tax=Methylopila capsulata TaxID=61654 RepID=A0A9W6MTV8_9HYPH|nr:MULTISPECIES: hypothetical protein [Methylopila]MBM7853264.1 hypothetical protein [Methylopila capsulata]GBD47232.1 hypothetical protein METY_0445 [Methylopila sp. Yamaguchi]GLK57521.1 hypothetical protein GCM10008170_35410 [Methylopila capsulata]